MFSECPMRYDRADYFALVDTTGRIIRENKKGYIAGDIPPVVSRLGINRDKWIEHIQCFGRNFGGCVGTVHHIQTYANRFHRRWGKGMSVSAGVYQKQAS
jgi:hypothetical protein